MESSPALFGCFDQDYEGCVYSADVKNVEILLQCTFLVCDCSFSANMSELPKPNKKTLYFHLYFRARKKVFPLPHQSFPRKYMEKTLIWTLSG